MNAGRLNEVLDRIQAELEARNSAREAALPRCRSIIRTSANAIRATHRGQLEEARRLLDRARTVHDEAVAGLRPFPALHHAGFLHDAQKEYVEAEALWHLATGALLPLPEDLGVEHPAYLNGLAETVGELRRMLLDRLREGRYEGCEEILATMDAIYTSLTEVDYPEALTAGLRRATDQVRSILERTRGDLTMAAIQRRR